MLSPAELDELKSRPGGGVGESDRDCDREGVSMTNAIPCEAEEAAGRMWCGRCHIEVARLIVILITKTPEASSSLRQAMLACNIDLSKTAFEVNESSCGEIGEAEKVMRIDKHEGNHVPTNQ